MPIGFLSQLFIYAVSTFTTHRIDMTKTKTNTALLCELTRLKAQQKYLEANQIKLTPENICSYNGAYDPSTATDACNQVLNAINEINLLKSQQDNEVNKFRLTLRTSAKDIYRELKQLRDDIKSENCTENLSLDSMRRKIVDISTLIDGLKIKNTNELKTLQSQYNDSEKNAATSA